MKGLLTPETTSQDSGLWKGLGDKSTLVKGLKAVFDIRLQLKKKKRLYLNARERKDLSPVCNLLRALVWRSCSITSEWKRLQIMQNSEQIRKHSAE